MPRIRKKTSRRGTTNQREKIKHKVAETRKKRKKDANKNTQWKSKHTKDPGIPNNFPYKDQILAEVAEERRQAQEAKQLRKEQKKALKVAATVGDTEDVEGESGAEDEEGSDTEAGAAFDGVTAMRTSKVLAGSSKLAKAASANEVVELDDSPLPTISELSSFKDVLDAADVVVEVVDARDPLAYHSSHLVELVKAKKGQKSVMVLNKIDACPREAVSSWSATLRAQFPVVLFRAASAFLPSAVPVPAKGKGKERADDAWGLDTVLSLLGQWAEEKPGDDPLAVAVVGFTNSGKSSFINSLSRKALLPIYQLSNVNEGPTTTTRAQELLLEISSKTVRFIDTPGYSWLRSLDQSAEDAKATRVRDILIRNKGRIDRLKDSEPVVHEIISRASPQDLMLFYNLPAFSENDTTAFLSALARANGLIKKGGVLDATGASRIVLRDWSTGKFPRYTVPSSTDESPSDASLASLDAKDEKILSMLPTRKELRKGTGVVKLIGAVPESRQLILASSWADGAEGSEDGTGEDEDGALGEEEEDDEDEDEEDEEDEAIEEDMGNEEENEEEEELLAGKRKRRAFKNSAASRPVEKVAFSAEPKNTKQARRAAGARGSLPAKAQSKPEASPAPAKSALKIKATKLKSAPTKKVANSGASKKTAANAAGDDEAYDFKSFF